mmetsp:Transcript_61362/g.97247  ORF Transcript_61362/g.97247 Transcript_61362/m.97247 type:complete len:243 (-) Transcript_61362:617-1345(-)
MLHDGLYRMHSSLFNGFLLADADSHAIGQFLPVDVFLLHSRTFDADHSFNAILQPPVIDIDVGLEGHVVCYDFAQRIDHTLSLHAHLGIRVNGLESHGANLSIVLGCLLLRGVAETSFFVRLFAGLIKNTQSLLGGRHLLRRQLHVGEGWDQPLQLFAQGIRQADAAAQHVAKSQLAFQVQGVLLVVLLTCKGHFLAKGNMMYNWNAFLWLGHVSQFIQRGKAPFVALLDLLVKKMFSLGWF